MDILPDDVQKSAFVCVRNVEELEMRSLFILG